MSISNTSVLIKRSTANSAPTALKSGELAYSYLSNTLFFGNSTGTGVVNIGGLLYTQTIDQATNNATSLTLVKRDATGNASFNYITANGLNIGNLVANTANAATYVTGATQNQITSIPNLNTVGTIGTGVWQGSVIQPSYIATLNQNTTGSANSATYATQLTNTETFSITGDVTASAQNFNGTQSVTLATTLTNVNPNPGTFGSSTQIPTFTVGANGRITGVTTNTISTSFTVTDGTHSNTVNGGSTLTLTNGGGVTATVNPATETVTFGVDNTILRSNTITTSPQIISGDLSISGNLIVTGTQSIINTAIVQVNDSMIELAANNNVGDVIDIGFYGVANNGTTQFATGLVRDAGSKNYYLFSNVAAGSISSANTIANNLFTQSNTATLFTNINAFQVTGNQANVTNATIGTLNLTNTLGLASGGTNSNAGAFTTAGQRVVYNGTSLVSQANTGTSTVTGTAAQTLTALAINNYGEVTGSTFTNIAIPASQLTNGTTGSGFVVLNTSPSFGGTVNFANANVVGLNVTTINVTSINVSSVQANSINIGTLTYVASGAFVEFGSNANSYQQVVIQNASQGTNASADYIVSNGDSTDGTLYGDFGINGPNFVGTGALGTANNVYLYSQNSDLAIGTGTSNAIHFVVNGGASDAMTISSSGVVTLGSALGVASGGTGNASYTPNQQLVYNGTNFTSLANAAYVAPTTLSTSNTITSVTVDTYGRVTGFTASAISILGSQVTTAVGSATNLSGGFANGVPYQTGAGATSFVSAPGTADQTWSNQIMTVTNAGVPTWSSAVDGGTF